MNNPEDELLDVEKLKERIYTPTRKKEREKDVQQVQKGKESRGVQQEQQ